MDVKLIVVGGKNAGRQLPISAPRFVIGRGADCQLRPGSPLVGTHHCAILVEEGRAVLEDLGTPSGTFVNGKQVTGRRELRTGDQLRIGPLEFEVQLTVTVGGKKKSKVQSIQEAAARLAETTDRDEIDVSVWIGDSSTDESIGEILQERRETATDWADETPTDPHMEANPVPKPSEAKPATANSRDAAADVLRQVFGKK
jgi:pSer/pThr/pTyr-binding forkhead associated (FHA) protein